MVRARRTRDHMAGDAVALAAVHGDGLTGLDIAGWGIRRAAGGRHEDAAEHCQRLTPALIVRDIIVLPPLADRFALGVAGARQRAQFLRWRQGRGPCRSPVCSSALKARRPLDPENPFTNPRYGSLTSASRPYPGSFGESLSGPGRPPSPRRALRREGQPAGRPIRSLQLILACWVARPASSTALRPYCCNQPVWDAF